MTHENISEIRALSLKIALSLQARYAKCETVGDVADLIEQILVDSETVLKELCK